MSLPVELRLQIYEYIFGVTSARQSTTVRYTLYWTYMDTYRNSLKKICFCPGRGDGRPHNYLRHHCNGPQVRFWTRKEYLLETMLSRNQIIDEPKIDAYLHAITLGNDILRVSQRIHAEALPILYKSRNLKFFGTDYLHTEYKCYSIAFFISSLSQYAKPHLQELTISLGDYLYGEKTHRYRRSFADFCDLISNELKGLQKLNIELGLFRSTMLDNLSRQSVRKRVKNLEDMRAQKGSFNRKYWWVDGAHFLGPSAALLSNNPELTLSITLPLDSKLYIPILRKMDDEKAFKEGRFYLNQEQVDRFFAKIEDKRCSRKARKAAGEGGMELPEGLEEFLLSCQDSM